MWRWYDWPRWVRCLRTPCNGAFTTLPLGCCCRPLRGASPLPQWLLYAGLLWERACPAKRPIQIRLKAACIGNR
ncbi:Uncharacterized protein PPKH_4892 [Pseudomonas putida]|nr:Uncharacterized protein PPKH_4892 [Pseudomonas putida]